MKFLLTINVKSFDILIGVVLIPANVSFISANTGGDVHFAGESGVISRYKYVLSINP